ADAPTEHANAIHHRRVAVRADHRIWKGELIVPFRARPYDARDVLQINLVADAGAGRNDLETPESQLRPTQKAISLTVAGVFDREIAAKRLVRAKRLDDNRMINDQMRGNLTFDLVRIGAGLLQGFAHGRQILDDRQSSRIGHEHAGRTESYFPPGIGVQSGVDQTAYVLG